MIIVYQFDNETGGFEEVEINENTPLFEILDADKILLFVDMPGKKVWMWEGKNTSTRMKFISAQEAPKIRDKHDMTFTVSSVDDGDETAAFKIFVGLP
ncbi:MAG: hypothetical protein ACW98D_05475 [Promethearchaeota archaeon]